MNLSKEYKIKILKKINKENLNCLDKLHFHSAPLDVMPNLPEYIKSIYYNKFNDYNNGLIITANLENKIIGFLILRFKEIKFNFDVKEKYFIIKHLCKMPKILISFFFQLFNLKKLRTSECEIDYFFVNKKFRSKKIGESLIFMSEKLANKHNKSKIFTKTNNYNLFMFYKNSRKAKLIKNFEVFTKSYYLVSWDIV